MIDPKKIAEWRELANAASARPDGTWAMPLDERRSSEDEAFALEARRAVLALLAERLELLALLREVEWAGNSAVKTCPVCEAVYHWGKGHAPECRLAAFLK